MEEAEEEEIKNKNSLEQLLTGDLLSPFPTELSPVESVRHVVRALISKYQCFVCSRSKSVKILFLDYYYFFLGGGGGGGGGWRGGGESYKIIRLTDDLNNAKKETRKKHGSSV